MIEKRSKKGITLIALVITVIVMLILAGVSINALVGDNGIISNAQKAKIDSEKAELWERIQEVLVEAHTIKFESLTDTVNWINGEFTRRQLDATAGIYDDDEETILITYGMAKGFYYNAIISNKMQYLGELEVAPGKAYESGSTENTGDWEIQLITEDKLDGLYNGSIGTARIIGYHGTYGDITIPNVVYYTKDGVTSGYFVTELGNSVFAFYNDEDGEKITSIKFNQGLQVIRYGCFRHDTLLSCTISFPNSLKYIGDNAFYNCQNMEGNLDTIANQGIIMGKNVFYGCKKMTGNIALLMPQRAEGQDYDDEVKAAFLQTDSETGNTYYAIPDGFLSGCQGLTGTLTIPYFIQKIGANAFYNCSGIEHIEYETFGETKNNLSEIGDYAFYGCSGNINDIEFPTSKFENTIKIGSNSYAYAKGGKIDLTNVSSIGICSFYYYQANTKSTNKQSFTTEDVVDEWNDGDVLHSASTIRNVVDLDLGDMITELPKQAFYRASLRDVTNSISRTGEYRFLDFGNAVFEYSYLRSFKFNISNTTGLSNCFTFSSSSAFSYCYYLESVEVPGLTTSVTLYNHTFYRDYRLKNVSFTCSGLTESVFGKCYSLERIDIDLSCTKISEGAFSECVQLSFISVNGNNYRN